MSETTERTETIIEKESSEEPKKSETTESNIEKAFEAVQRSAIEEYKPVSKEKLLGSLRKNTDKEPIVLPMTLDGEIVHLTFRHPQKIDYALAGGNIFSDHDFDKDKKLSLDNSDPEQMGKLLEYSRAFVQRLLEDPYMTLGEVGELDDLWVLNAFNAIDAYVKKDGAADVASFREVGESE